MKEFPTPASQKKQENEIIADHESRLSHENEAADVLFDELGTPNFTHVARSIHPERMDAVQLATVREAALRKIQDVLLMGHFGDLHGADALLSKLGITELSIGEDVQSDLNVLLLRLDQRTLTGLALSQPAARGDYDLNAARRILKAYNFSADELSDARLKTILDYRGILLELHRRRVTQIDSPRELLRLADSTGAQD